jgi:hypothetical protein
MAIGVKFKSKIAVYVMGEGKMSDEVTYDDYNELCGDCEYHDECHREAKNGICWDKVAECKRELEMLRGSEE